MQSSSLIHHELKKAEVEKTESKNEKPCTAALEMLNTAIKELQTYRESKPADANSLTVEKYKIASDLWSCLLESKK